MNEASERVLLKFAELLKNNPNGNVPFLWVQAGGRVASQQNVQRTGFASLFCRHGIMGCIVCEQEKEAGIARR